MRPVKSATASTGTQRPTALAPHRNSRGAGYGLRPVLAAVVLAVAVAAGVSAAPASAEEVWWHLTSGTRPAVIEPETARNEVRKLVVEASSGEYTLSEPVIANTDLVERHLEQVEGRDFVKLPVADGPVLIRKALERLYGEGNVRVSELAPHEFEIVFRNGKGNQPVELSAGGEVTLSRVQRGASDGEIYATAENVGDATLTGEHSPLVLKDVLPPGWKAVAIAATKPNILGEILRRVPLSCDLETVSCSLTGVLAPYDQIEVRIAVNADPEAPPSGGAPNTVSISGGEGFTCAPTLPGKGKYEESGCLTEATGTEEVEDSEGKKVKVKRHGSFERTATGTPQPTSIERAVPTGIAPGPFGVESYELTHEEEGGGPVTQAGKHPFQQTTTVTLNQLADGRPVENVTHKPSANPINLAKDVHFKWPPGLIGNPQVIPQCTEEAFYAGADSGRADGCLPNTAVGVATVTSNEPSTAEVSDVTVPLFNLKPHVGEPARFGFAVPSANIFVTIDTAVRAGGDYGITVSSNNITQTAALLSSEVTVWGVPGDPRHNRQRGWSCLEESRGNTPEGLASCAATETLPSQQVQPFLSMPTSCEAPLATSVEADSWANKGAYTSLTGEVLPATPLDGCNRLPFAAEIKVAPDVQDASTPSGLTVDVHVPQEAALNPAGLAQSNIRDIHVVLPEGVQLNPSSADGLQACSEAQIGYEAPFSNPPGQLQFSELLPDPLLQGTNFCPDASKVGTVKITTPLLPNPLEGAVYLATPAPNGEDGQNPFKALVAMYIVAKDPVSGALVKLPGRVGLNQSTGLIESTFENTPQLAFEDAELHFFGGERAPLATPSKCGTYTTQATFTPWSGTPPVSTTSSFQITSGPNGTPCPGQSLPFDATLQAGTVNNNAGQFTALSTTLSRPSGNQDIERVQLKFPDGLSGLLSSVALCGEAQANAGSCGPESLIGETVVSVGVGGEPFTVTGGRVYITGPYHGAPFGLSIVNPAVAGPFDLGQVIVRAKVQVDPITAALTVTTNSVAEGFGIPRILDGIPLQIQHVNVLVNRSGFTFNPTSCDPMGIAASIGSFEGALAGQSNPFQVANCANLKYEPKLETSTPAHASKANGTALTFKISYPKASMGKDSWFHYTKFTLPKQLPARLTTIQKACLASTFETNRAACPPQSIIGHALVHTQVLPVPLEGPVYFVSYGGAAFPDAVIVLKGYGITVELHGHTFINGKTNETSATFNELPDVPFESIEVNLPAGPFSEFGSNLPASANSSFCGQKLVMPTEFRAANGAEIKQNATVLATGCPKVKAKTRRQLLAAALAACHKKHGKKRKGCEQAARRRYGKAAKANRGGRGGNAGR